METIVYLCRHGAYENPHEVFHGRLPGFPLSQIGKDQVKHLAQTLAGQPIAAVYASPLIRAFDTAKIIASVHQLTVITDERLLDIRSPTQGRTISYMESINWNQYRPEFIAAGGERLSEVYARMRDFMDEHIAEHLGKQFVVVSHGDSIMTLKVKYLGGKLSLSAVRQKYGYIGKACCIKLTFNDEGQFLALDEFDKAAYK